MCIYDCVEYFVLCMSCISYSDVIGVMVGACTLELCKLSVYKTLDVHKKHINYVVQNLFLL